MPIRDVSDAIREFKSGRSKHIKSRKQAIAVGLESERRGKRKPMRNRRKGRKRKRY